MVVKNVYRGDMAQLTIRSALTGFLLGGVLSATALYIAGKTGITIGVGLISVISRSPFSTFWPRPVQSDFTIRREQLHAVDRTAAGYMVTPLCSGLWPPTC